MTPMNDYIKYMDGCFFYFFQNYYILYFSTLGMCTICFLPPMIVQWPISDSVWRVEALQALIAP